MKGVLYRDSSESDESRRTRVAKEEKRYLWKTVRPYSGKGETILAKSLNDEKGGWRLGVKRTVRGAVELCWKGFHGNRNPMHAIQWEYGSLLALIEVGGKSGRHWYPARDNDSNKECYARATLVGLWEVKDLKEAAKPKRLSRKSVVAGLQKVKPIAGRLPKDFVWSSKNRYEWKGEE